MPIAVRNTDAPIPNVSPPLSDRRFTDAIQAWVRMDITRISRRGNTIIEFGGVRIDSQNPFPPGAYNVQMQLNVPGGHTTFSTVLVAETVLAFDADLAIQARQILKAQGKIRNALQGSLLTRKIWEVTGQLP